MAFKQPLLHLSTFSLLANSPCMASEGASVLLSRDFSRPHTPATPPPPSSPHPQWRAYSEAKVRLVTNYNKTIAYIEEKRYKITHAQRHKR